MREVPELTMLTKVDILFPEVWMYLLFESTFANSLEPFTGVKLVVVFGFGAEVVLRHFLNPAGRYL